MAGINDRKEHNKVKKQDERRRRLLGSHDDISFGTGLMTELPAETTNNLRIGIPNDSEIPGEPPTPEVDRNINQSLADIDVNNVSDKKMFNAELDAYYNSDAKPDIASLSTDVQAVLTGQRTYINVLADKNLAAGKEMSQAIGENIQENYKPLPILLKTPENIALDLNLNTRNQIADLKEIPANFANQIADLKEIPANFARQTGIGAETDSVAPATAIGTTVGSLLGASLETQHNNQDALRNVALGATAGAVASKLPSPLALPLTAVGAGIGLADTSKSAQEADDRPIQEVDSTNASLAEGQSFLNTLHYIGGGISNMPSNIAGAAQAVVDDVNQVTQTFGGWLDDTFH